MLRTIYVSSLILAAYAQAATIHVPGDYSSIQAAINAANDGDRVQVAPNNYFMPQSINFNGKSIEVRGDGPETTTLALYGEDPPVVPVVMFENGEGPGAVLSGFTIRGGNTNRGGGIYCAYYSDPTISNCKITGNTADAFGGGMYCFYSSPTISDCTISQNSGPEGAGIYCTYSSPTLSNCTITGNTASDYGGGLDCRDSSPTLTNCTISDNSADGGGGISCQDSSSPTLANCTIANNSAEGESGGYGGGGLYCAGSSRPTLSNCTITGNSVEFRGGGGLACNSASPTLTHCTITGNSTRGDFGQGGGLYCSLAFPSLTNCTIAGNTAHDLGGGLYCNDASAPVLTNCTIADNSTTASGGGIYCDLAFPELTNCTITGNRASSPSGSGGGLCYTWLSYPELTNCILWGDTPEEISSSGYDPSDLTLTYSNVEGGWEGEGNINANPNFATKLGYAYILGAGSPCIDAGTGAEDGLTWGAINTNYGARNGIDPDMGAYGGPAAVGAIGGDHAQSLMDALVSAGAAEHVLGAPFLGKVPSDWENYSARIETGGYVYLDLGGPPWWTSPGPTSTWRKWTLRMGSTPIPTSFG